MKKACCSACAKGRPCCGTRSNPSVKLTADQIKGVKGQIDWLVGRISVATPDEEVVEEIRDRLSASGVTGSDATKLLRHAISTHRKNQRLYSQVMRGSR